MIADVLGQLALNLLRTAELAWLLLVAAGVGNLLLRRLFPGERTGIGELAASLGLGLGALELAVLALGAAGLLRTAPIAVVLALLTALAAFAARRRGGAVALPPAPSAETRAHLALLAGGAFLAWLLSCAPPLFYDTLVYHLGVPNLYLLRGGIVPLPHNVYSGFPLGTEMLYLLGLALDGPHLAILFSWAFCLLAALALAALVLPRWGAPAAALAAALFVLAPPVQLLARLGTVEPALAFFCLLAWSGLFGGPDPAAPDRPAKPAAIALAGIFGGLAFSTKYLGGILGVALPVAVLLLRRRTADAARFAGAAALVAAPWLAKDALFTGNPVYPAFFGLFGGAGWSAAQAGALAVDAHAAWTRVSSPLDILQLPLALVLGTGNFGTASRWGWIWLPVFAAAVFLAVRRPAREERLLLGLFGSALAIWAGSFWMARFLVPALGLGMAIVAVVVERTGPRRRDVGPALAAAVAVVAGLSILADEPARDAVRPALGLQAPRDYLRAKIRVAPAVEFVNGSLPPSARILLLGEARSAYLRRDHEFATVLDRPLLPELLGAARDDAGIAAALAGAGVTHVLVNAAELRRTAQGYPESRTPDEILLPFLDFLLRRCRLLASGREVFVFELPGAPAGRGPVASGAS